MFIDENCQKNRRFHRSVFVAIVVNDCTCTYSASIVPRFDHYREIFFLLGCAPGLPQDYASVIGQGLLEGGLQAQYM